MTCKDIADRLSWYIDGEAPELEPHLRGCAACRETLDRLRRADDLLAAAARQGIDSGPSRAQRIVAEVRSRSRRRWLPFAAAAVVLLGFGGLWSYMNVRTADPQEVLVFGAKTWVAGTTGVLRVVVRDALRQVPVAGAAVYAMLGGQRAEAVSGADGSAEIRLPAADGRLVVEVRSSAGYDRLEETIAVERPVRIFLSTDKPLYQPTQTVHMRALAMSAFTGKPWEGDLALTVEDANGNRVFRKDLRTSAYGIASADLALADEVILGTWRVTATAGGATSERTVDVKRYVLPKFKVDLRTERGVYAPGETVKGALEATYTFGKPVAGGSVKVELAAWEVDRFKVFGTATTTTDAAGKASFETRIPDRLFGTELARGDATVRVEAAVTDGASHLETKAVALAVTTTPLRVEVFPEGGEFVRGATERLTAVASYADGAAARVSIEVDGRRFDTDDAGVATLPVGREVFTLRARDAKGLSVEKRIALEDWAGRQDFVLRTDKAEYKGGETLNASVVSTRDGVIYLDLVKADQTLLTKSVELRKGRGGVAIDLPAELSGTLRLSAYRILPNGSTLRDSRNVLVSSAGELKIRPRLSKPEFKPGEEIDVELEVLGSDGRPVAAALGMAVVDEAVFALHTARPGLEKTFFQIEEDLMTPRWQLKPGGAPLPIPLRLEAAPEPDVVACCSSLHAEKVAALAASTEEFNEGALAVAGVTVALGVVAGLVWGLIALGRSFGFVVALLVLFILIPVIVIPGLLSSQRASNERFAPVAAAPAARDYEVPRPPEPSKGETGSASPRIREFFPETLYWNPQIISDERGRARVSFPGADSITTWRMALSAVSKDGRLGGEEGGVRVFQPFFVDLDLPVSLTQGDEVWIPVAVYSYLQTAQTVRLSFEAEGGFDVLGEREKAVEVKPGEVSSIRFHVRARDFGAHKLTVKAIGSEFSDAVRRAIEVLPDGKEMGVSASDRLSGRARIPVRIPAEAVDGASRLWVRLYPSTFSEIVTGLEGLVRLPYG